MSADATRTAAEIAAALRPSRRGLTMPPSPVRKLVPLADEAKARGTHVYHLNIGQPDVPTPPLFFESIRNADIKVLSYENSKGQKPLIEAMQRYYATVGIDVERANIQVTTGGSEAMIFGVLAATDPGDEIVVFEPFYGNYSGICVAAGATAVPVACDPKTGFHPPAPDVIERVITDKTRALIICSPNNPTGTVWTRAEMEAVVDIARRRDVFIISDEVYREFCYGVSHTSIMDFPEIADRAIMVDSISKRFSACGARIGAVVSRNTEINRAVLHLGMSRLCSPTLEQIGATPLMDLPKSYYEEMNAEYLGRRDLLARRLEAMPGVFCQIPEGAFYLQVTLPVDSSETFCQWLLTDFAHDSQTVMLAPGPGFYASKGRGGSEVRIAYVLCQEDLDKAMNVLVKALEAYPGRTL